MPRQETLPPDWFRRLALYSVSSAVCAVIPVPFLDDHLQRRTRRRMVRELATQEGLELSQPALEHLSGTEGRRPFGCFFGLLVALLFKLVFKVLRRIFRSILLFLAVKDAADAASRTFHEGFLLHVAMPELTRRLALLEELPEEDRPPPRQGAPWEIRGLRRAIETTCSEVDTRPLEGTIKGVLRGSRRLLKRTARTFARQARQAETSVARDPSAPEESVRLAPDLVDAMIGALSREAAYFRDLEAHFHRRWDGEAATGGTSRDRNSPLPRSVSDSE